MYRILIVEDDFDISELLQSWLTEAGYQTAEAEDGLKALEVFESGQPRIGIQASGLLRHSC